MGVNPLEYDVEELRKLQERSAHERSVGNLGVRLPYLASLPAGTEPRAFVLDWLSELVATGGFDGAVAALEYYRFMGWLAPEAREEIEAHLLGVGNRSGSFEDLDRTDHMRSLARIARLAEWAASADER
jgi:archaellum component FlaD/FlaE